MPYLRELTSDMPYARLEGDPNTVITGIAYDSRLLKPGDLFVALPGFHVDSTAFIPQAIQKGAAAVATQRPEAAIPEGVARLLVPDTRSALTDLAAAFYGFPARRIRVVGVTGTDGKTTTTHLISAVLEAMGHGTGFITTADVKVGGSLEYNDTQHTTPEPVEVQCLLRRMVDERLDYAILESSSHALALNRLLHCEFDAAVFTNLSPEHLNFHGSLEAYLMDKARLFAMLDSAVSKGVEKVAVLNADDPASVQMAAATRARQVWYGIDTHHSSLITHHSFIRATDVQLLPTGSRFRLIAPEGEMWVESHLTGLFNVHNWLAAAALGISQGATLQQVQRAIATVDSVPGRMQRIDSGQPFSVVVDFAHTPQALGKALSALRQSTSGRLFVLFGQAGERDPGNRAEMGRIAARLADFAVFTTDDPRFEEPMEIAEQVAAGAVEAGWREGADYLKIEDRAEALRELLGRARPGDTVLLAGKGHERRQVIRDRLVPWNDAEAARMVLSEMGFDLTTRAPGHQGV